MTESVPEWVGWLPPLNAFLNAASAVLLVVGYRHVRARRIGAHRRAMTGAFATSLLFLASYLTLHAQVGSTPFPGTGWPRWIYLAILISHATLAAALVPLVGVTLLRAWRGSFADHARLARWTLPIWLYVSATGVLVYVILYHLVGA